MKTYMTAKKGDLGLTLVTVAKNMKEAKEKLAKAGGYKSGVKETLPIEYFEKGWCAEKYEIID